MGTTALWGGSNYAHFTDGEADSQRAKCMPKVTELVEVIVQSEI